MRLMLCKLDGATVAATSRKARQNIRLFGHKKFGHNLFKKTVLKNIIWKKYFNIIVKY